MDILADKIMDKTDLDFSNSLRRVETARFGPFKLQTGIDSSSIETLYLRVCDAQKRFSNFPLHQLSEQLEPEIIASSIYSTNSIEGGALTLKETQAVLNLSADQVEEIERRRVDNLKQAYELAKQATANPDWVLDMPWIKSIHAAITLGLPHEHNQPGVLRANTKALVTRVGSESHGGVYKPPQYHGDVELLLSELVDWNNKLKSDGVPALIRAPLVHLYFELIHPFFDGNGRAGRVIEASILLNDGFKYAPFAMAAHYFESIDKYFALFNVSRKTTSKDCNTEFVTFFLEGMLDALNKLHDRCNMITAALFYQTRVKVLHDNKKLNDRQYTIIRQVENSPFLKLSDFPNLFWYTELYTRLSMKTAKRDLDKLLEMELIAIQDGKLFCRFF